MRYRSRPTECEAMQWNGNALQPSSEHCRGAHEIVAWVNANGGEARYEPVQDDGWAHLDSGRLKRDPVIAVRTINGWAYAAPGHYVVMGTAKFADPYQPLGAKRHVRDFYPCDPETFERRWEQLGGGAS